MPALSIVTINYNNMDSLQKTIDSVFAQTFVDYEYIIIDGGSTDGSKELIQQHSNKLAYWLSEKDDGIYNAMNKGIAVAKGDYLIFMNSGDFFVNETILKEVSFYLKGTDIVYGNLIIKSPANEWVKKYSEEITFSYFFNDTLPHQASFISRNILAKYGNTFDESLKISADWKFFLDVICKLNATIKYIDKEISVYDYTGISSIPENYQILLDERSWILENEYGYFYEEIKGLMEFKKKYWLLSRSRFVRFYQKWRNKF